MADFAFSGHDDFDGITSPVPLSTAAPQIEMVQNLSFSFPRRPQSGELDSNTGAPQLRWPETPASDRSTRPLSMQIPSNRPHTAGSYHRRGVSTLPSFNFNASSANGLVGEDRDVTSDATSSTTPSPAGPIAASPTRRHKRYTSELVGGDSRLGFANAISSSPTRSPVAPSPLPSSGLYVSHPTRGHGHRRSVALSSHDLSTITSPAQQESSSPDEQSQVSPSHHWSMPLSQTPDTGDIADPFTGPSEDSLARTPSRPRVGFSDDVEFIPRPLSIISSEASSTTRDGHSVNNSISSMLSMGTPSPPANRVRTTSLGTTFENEPDQASGITFGPEPPTRDDREGDWLRRGSALPTAAPRPRPGGRVSRVRPVSYSDDSPRKSFAPHMKRHSIGHALSLDRRRSEPTINVLGQLIGDGQADSVPKQGNIPDPHDPSDRRSTTQKFKQWAKSVFLLKTKEPEKAAVVEHSSDASSSPAVSLLDFSGVLPPAPEPETDLDAVLGQDNFTASSRVSRFPQRLDHAPFFTPQASNNPAVDHIVHAAAPRSRRDDEDSSMLDLDAALGPFQTPMNAGRTRREMHSGRLSRDMGNLSAPYLPPASHRRTESAPSMTPFQYSRNTPPQAAMADVFEEDEEDDEQGLIPRPSTASAIHHQSSNDESTGTGVQIVDADPSANAAPHRIRGLDDGLRIHRGAWDADRPATSYGAVSSRLTASILAERRTSSLLDDVIIEEPSPVESSPLAAAAAQSTLEVMENYEERRAPSLTKSSESSETPTLMAAPLPVPDVDGARSLTPETSLASSAFSTPDFTRRQSSFDTSRVGTSASSVTDNRTMSSCTNSEPVLDPSVFSDDAPSLTSSRSTMLSIMHANNSRRDLNAVRPSSVASGSSDLQSAVAEKRRKRSSIQSLSQLVGSPFGPKSSFLDTSRPQTAAGPILGSAGRRSSSRSSSSGTHISHPKKKENRLSKLMFWKKHRQASTSSALM